MSATDPKFAELHSQLFDEGLEVRRAVLGREYVDNAVKNATPFTRPGQELITEWAWGTIWKRPGLDRKQRSLLSKCTNTLQPSPQALGGHDPALLHTLCHTTSTSPKSLLLGKITPNSFPGCTTRVVNGRNLLTNAVFPTLSRFGNNHRPEGVA